MEFNALVYSLALSNGWSSGFRFLGRADSLALETGTYVSAEREMVLIFIDEKWKNGLLMLYGRKGEGREKKAEEVVVKVRKKKCTLK